MGNEDYLKDISEIKKLMNRSSRFISLSGLSGIFAGIYAIIGASIAYPFLKNNYSNQDVYSAYTQDYHFLILVSILLLVALFSIITAYVLTTKKAKINEEKIWDITTKRLLLNFLIPLITGGVYIIIVVLNGHYGLASSLMLIFYGLSLVNASKYTIGNVKYLGYAQILVGLVSALLPSYGYWFWVLGFGILHIVYGSLMYKKERKAAK